MEIGVSRIRSTMKENFKKLEIKTFSILIEPIVSRKLSSDTYFIIGLDIYSRHKDYLNLLLSNKKFIKYWKEVFSGIEVGTNRKSTITKYPGVLYIRAKKPIEVNQFINRNLINNEELFK